MGESDIKQCKGYKQLAAAVKKSYDDDPSRGFDKTLDWAVERAKHYAERTGIPASEILDAWEKDRNYWCVNYYQDAKQPLLDGTIKVFDTWSDLLNAIDKKQGFRCPACSGVSRDAYECSCDGCDWKVYGLLRDLGKGVRVFVKEAIRSDLIFMPVSWETSSHPSEEGEG
ncbi:hypothetical protein KS4_23650 [Poriferisphaera corsica]|uniref:Uncharacterized protein n=2 Tax=Poriferisphaera corsica TaxID=2528020 RepID=A0A517YVN0_9BACT|nr:hypothetical protein KS4_23650 [Poriferisphaera corsica]